MSLRNKLRSTGPLESIDPDATPGAPGDKEKTQAATEELGADLAELQERLYAEGTLGGRRGVLLILQGMDTSGKGGTIKKVVGHMNPIGCHIASFKKPTEEEQRHHFLWRIRKQLPPPGKVGVFDRSHYEDVLIVRVHDLAPWDGRYEEINAFERELAEDEITVVKVCLHISWEEQRERLLARLHDPTKHWKFNAGDIAERKLWPRYMEAYDAALGRCSEAAPWYVVPANRKWYRNWAVATLLLETLRDLDPEYPARPDLDIGTLEAELSAD
jgi:PPK2 family polyphosphate:nucleotide phosphotransferase